MHKNSRRYEAARGSAAPRMAARNSAAGDRTGQRQNRIRMVQLVVSFALFMAVFLGNGILPSGMSQVRDRILSVLTAETNFRALFSQIGTAISADAPLYESLGDICMEVFGAGERENDPGEEKQVLQPVDLLSVESKFLSSSPSPVTLAEHYRTPNGPNIALSLEQPAAEPVQPEAPEPEEPTEEVVPAVGTVLLKGDDGGEAPPEKYSLDYLSFGGLETTTPVLGNITSAYGYRTHPIKGNYQFHGGLDIGGQAGEPIHAFAAGTVEYIGKNDSYGLYLQLDHGSGIKSFYAHCKSLCVKKGQTVTLGETIGTVGSSGSATGPHLHLELKYNGLHLDPAYYVQPVSAQ